jgi:hypothetical protein
MKNLRNRILASLGVLAALVGSTGIAQSSNANTATYVWPFDSSANPTAPGTVSGGVADAQATIVPGNFSSGYISSNPILGSANGVWDLGSGGTITMQSSAGLSGAGDPASLVTVNVVQYQDGGLYNQLAAVAVPGGTLMGTSSSIVSTTSLGWWTAAQSQWSVPAGTPVGPVVVTGATDGSLVDQVSIQVAAAALPKFQLTIQNVGSSQVQISWPSSYGGTLEFTPALGDPQGWTPVQPQPPVQTNNGTASVILNADAGARFYRLKQ